MSRLLVLLTLVGAGQGLRLRSPLPPTGSPEPEPMWFSQTLDHFNIRDTRSWQQRYWAGWEYYKQGGPVFLLIGGEGEENPGWLQAGALHDNAKQFGGAMFILEHRYYGKSRPVPDLSVKNLAWLSSHQALSDLASFIVSMKQTHDLSGPWIAVGGSYPGSLAGWLRLKYPHLVQGAVASSGPVNAKPNFPEYLEVVRAALDTEDGGQCDQAVRTAVARVQYLTQHRVGWAMLGKMFRLCQPFDGTRKENIATLVETLLGNFETIVQYNKDRKTGRWANVTTGELCSLMTNKTGGSELHRFAAINDLSLEMAGAQCLDADYDNKVAMLQVTNYTDPASRVPGDVGNRQWLYQTCTQFGWYQSSDQPGHPFGAAFPLSFFTGMCSDVFGPKFSAELVARGTALTMAEYGGLAMQVTNVVFVQGSLDPWHALGITEDISPSAPAILIQGTAHCANLYPASEEDSQPLKEARVRIGQFIGTWIKQTE